MKAYASKMGSHSKVVKLKSLGSGLLCLSVLLTNCLAQSTAAAFSDWVATKTYTITTCESGPVVEESGLEPMPLQELVQFITEDVDFDGKSSLVDVCPQNPYCSERTDIVDADGDGRPAWGDVDDQDPTVQLFGDPNRDSYPSQDEVTKAILTYPGPEEIGDAALAENEALGLYPPDALIDAAEAAGIGATTIARWRLEYGGQ